MTKFAVRAISEGLRQEAGDKLRVTIVSPGFVRTNFAESVNDLEVKAQIAASMDSFAIPADAIARAIAFAIEQPADGCASRLMHSDHFSETGLNFGRRWLRPSGVSFGTNLRNMRPDRLIVIELPGDGDPPWLWSSAVFCTRDCRLA
jgi:hypothetical protein